MGGRPNDSQNSSDQETQGEQLDGNLMGNNVQQLEKRKPKEIVLGRRLSPRLQKIPEEKRPYYGPDRRKSLDSANDDDDGRTNDLDFLQKISKKMKIEVGSSIIDWIPCAGRQGMENMDSEIDPVLSSANVEFVDAEVLELEDNAYLKWTDYESFLADGNKKNAGAKEENRSEKTAVDSPQNTNGKKKKGNSSTDTQHSTKRPDLKAVNEMQKRDEIVYPDHKFGHPPGILVGHTFYSRCEMVAVGFHSHWLNGIGYIGKSSSKLKELNGSAYPLAVAIVLSGQYEDDADHINEVVYTGSGGIDLLGKKHQFKDQVMGGGNLALKNNLKQRIPVIVIRGHKSASGSSTKIYTYCGLYKVINHWAEKGVSGYSVFKYRLKRLLGQPKVDIEQVHFIRGRVSEASTKLAGLVCEDISYGEEDIPIPVTNTVDNAKLPVFGYTKVVEYSSNVNVPPTASGCKCKGNCTNAKKCSCAQLNGSDFPYVPQDGGRLIEPKNVVYECGPGCSCGPSCVNRVSQWGLKYRLEVYRTENKGWAVRSWDFIPSGAPVCEYTGVLRRNDELDNISENDYIFDIDCWHTMNGIGGRERRQGDVSVPANNFVEKVDDKTAESESEFCVDAGSRGNVARFINHSCEPNLFVQCVLSSHHNIKLPRILLVASDNVPPMQELTYDYGYALDSVIGADGKLKQLPCNCGTNECRGRLY